MKRLIACLIALCLVLGLCATVFAAPAADAGEETVAGESAEGESAEGESESEEGEATDAAAGDSAESEGDTAAGEAADAESSGDSADAESDGESAEGESEGDSGDSEGMMLDTTQGGMATSAPPDNSTRPINILGSRAAFYFEYTEDGYTATQNITDSYTVTAGEIGVPVVGEEFAISGLYIECASVDWDEENTVGNSGIIFNALTDKETTFAIGGTDDVYDAPNGEKYNSVVIMKVDPEEEYDTGAQETAPGVGIGINGKRLSLNNVYVEATGASRPTIHVPTANVDRNVKQLSQLVCVDSFFINHTTRALLLMGGEVWFLNSKALAGNWGALSYDFTGTKLYAVNSYIQNTGAGYAIYDAAGCDAYVYGCSIVSNGIGIMVARNAALHTAPLADADDIATEPYNGTADLLTPDKTADGRTVLAGYGNAVKIHADMSAADTVAVVYLKDTFLSTFQEDVDLYDTGEFTEDEAGASGGGSGGGSSGDGAVSISSIYSDYTDGDAVGISCHNGSVTFDNCEVKTRTGVLVHSFYSHDTMASGIFPVDGAEYAGDSVTIMNMKAEGDIIHDDWMRKMIVTLENAELTGKVFGVTLTGWNNYWRAQIAEIGGTADDEPTVIRDEVYETLWGVRMSVDGTSVWNVTDTSQLYSFVAAEGAVIQPAEGKTMTIYVDCPKGNDLEAYDITGGTQIEAFEPGVEYEGVVIVVE